MNSLRQMDLRLPSSYPEGTVLAHGEPGREIATIPRVLSRDLSVGPFIGGSGRDPADEFDAYEDEINSTCGSEEPEVMRFSLNDGVLHSLLLGFPFESVGQLDSNAQKWETAATVGGLLRLDEEQHFSLERPTYRLVGEDASILMAVSDWGLDLSASNRLRLRVARDVFLLFADGLYCGWQVENPVDYLVPKHVTNLAQPHGATAEARAFFHRYLLIVDEECLGCPDPRELTPVDHRLLELYHDLQDRPVSDLAEQAIREELEILLRTVLVDQGRMLDC